jgi:hypothetical protein
MQEMNTRERLIQTGWDRLWVVLTAGWGIYLAYDLLQLGPEQLNGMQTLFGSLWLVYFFFLLLGWAALVSWSSA